jgi:hypothetical protein
MTARSFAAVCGVLYLCLGLIGFVPALWERPPSAPPLSIRVFYASLFGVFVVNIVLSMMHGIKPAIALRTSTYSEPSIRIAPRPDPRLSLSFRTHAATVLWPGRFRLAL